jgi:hypothetical protein
MVCAPEKTNFLAECSSRSLACFPRRSHDHCLLSMPLIFQIPRHPPDESPWRSSTGIKLLSLRSLVALYLGTRWCKTQLCHTDVFLCPHPFARTIYAGGCCGGGSRFQLVVIPWRLLVSRLAAPISCVGYTSDSTFTIITTKAMGHGRPVLGLT